MEDSPAMSIQRWAEAPLLPDIHLALQLLLISEHYLSATWRDSCCQHLTQTLWQHQPGHTLSLASNDCWEKVPSACLTAAESWWSGFVTHVFLTWSPFGGVHTFRWCDDTSHSLALVLRLQRWATCPSSPMPQVLPSKTVICPKLVGTISTSISTSRCLQNLQVGSEFQGLNYLIERSVQSALQHNYWGNRKSVISTKVMQKEMDRSQERDMEKFAMKLRTAWWFASCHESFPLMHFFSVL